MLLLADYTPDTAPAALKQSDRPAAADCSEDNLETPPFRLKPTYSTLTTLVSAM